MARKTDKGGCDKERKHTYNNTIKKKFKNDSKNKNETSLKTPEKRK